ncbi:unnamed protein product [Dibothriocephalus latus]|uniref:Dynein regulatory complex subunit 3 n=1 Tax=Dibothriocephalus latus TaxID=60516 RepID=A0A3P7NW91_DIBLA|nr:unnamed protein product [Dibothriocephalus latus]
MFKEPSVISDDMLKEATKLPENGQQTYEDVKNILRIDFLWEFKNITKLQLNNNHIEKIEGLDHLVNLLWLDLSFNEITSITGLSNLVKLQDLSLHKNNISSISNLHAFEKLQVFSIGGNKLSELNEIIHLRKFPELRVLNVENNPFCSNEDTEGFILAFLPKLVYLDYGLCDELKRSNAIEKYHLKLREVQSQEESAQKKAELEEEAKRLQEKYKEAFIDGLEDGKLFVSVFTDSADNVLPQLPGCSTIVERYPLKYTFNHNQCLIDASLIVSIIAISEELFNCGIRERDERDAEVENVIYSLSEAKAGIKENCLRLIEDFQTNKNARFEKLARLEDAREVQTSLEEYRKEINNLWNKLMGFEVSLMDQMDDIIKEFETTMNDLVDRFIQNVEDYMGTCRDAELHYYEQMSEHCFQLLERIAKNEVRLSLNEDLFEVNEV